MTTINAIGAKTASSAKIVYTNDISKKEKNELNKLLSGNNWAEYDLDGNGKLDKSEVYEAKMNILSENEEGNNNLFAGENNYSEKVSKDGSLTTITKMPDGTTTKCIYDKNGNIIEEIITDKNGKSTSFKYKYDEKTGFVLD